MTGAIRDALAWSADTPPYWLALAFIAAYPLVTGRDVDGHVADLLHPHGA